MFTQNLQRYCAKKREKSRFFGFLCTNYISRFGYFVEYYLSYQPNYGYNANRRI